MPTDVAEPQGVRNGREDEARVAEWGEGDEADPVRERGAGLGRDLQRQAGLADAAGAGQGEEADIEAA